MIGAAGPPPPGTLRFLRKALERGYVDEHGELLFLARWTGGGRFEAPRFIAISTGPQWRLLNIGILYVAVGRTRGDDLFVSGQTLMILNALAERGVSYQPAEFRISGVRDAQLGEEADVVLQVKVAEDKCELVRVSIAGEKIRLR